MCLLVEAAGTVSDIDNPKHTEFHCVVIPSNYSCYLRCTNSKFKMSSKATDSDNEDDVINCQFKIILLGDGAVGKTSIATRFSEDKFSQNYKQTVGVDFFIKRINMPRKFLSSVLPCSNSMQLICKLLFSCGILVGSPLAVK